MVQISSISILMRSYFSRPYLEIAMKNKEVARQIEAKGAPITEQERADHRFAVITAVIMSVLYVEAMVNEICCDASDRHGNRLSSEQMDVVGSLWDSGIDKLSLVEKCKCLTAALHRPPMNLGSAPQQHIALLISLRNALVHFKPESTPAGVPPKSPGSHRLDKLHGLFIENQIMANTGNPFFPDKCLSAGCASWAIDTAKGFAAEFLRASGLQAAI